MHLLSFDVNWLAVLVAAASSMVVGFVWYHKSVFGAKWMAAIGKTEEELQSGSQTALIWAFVLSLVTAFIMANLVAWVHATTWMDGAMIGLIIGIGLITLNHAMHNIFSQRSMNLTIINGLGDTVTLIIMGIILAVWS